MWPDFVQGCCFNLFFLISPKHLSSKICIMCMHTMEIWTFLSITSWHHPYQSWFCQEEFSLCNSDQSYFQEEATSGRQKFSTGVFYILIEREKKWICSYVACEERDIVFNIIRWLRSELSFFYVHIDNNTQWIALCTKIIWFRSLRNIICLITAISKGKEHQSELIRR